MRIISGKFKGRKFYPPANNWPTRPTTDFNKEALYNILQNRIDFEDIKFLDLFGGTGSHCYECISRGCEHATYVDKFRGAVAFVHKIAGELGVESAIKIFKNDVFRFCQHCNDQFDFIFAGPPYPLKTLDKIPDAVFKGDLLAPNGLFVIEHDLRVSFEKHENFDEARQYGQTCFTFFTNKTTSIEQEADL